MLFVLKLLAEIFNCNEEEIEFLENIIGDGQEIIDIIHEKMPVSVNELKEIIFKYGCQQMQGNIRHYEEYTEDLIPINDFQLLKNEQCVPYVHCTEGDKYGEVLTEIDIVLFNYNTGLYIDNWQRKDRSMLWDPEPIEFEELEELEDTW